MEWRSFESYGWIYNCVALVSVTVILLSASLTTHTFGNRKRILCMLNRYRRISLLHYECLHVSPKNCSYECLAPRSNLPSYGFTSAKCFGARFVCHLFAFIGNPHEETAFMQCKSTCLGHDLIWNTAMEKESPRERRKGVIWKMANLFMAVFSLFFASAVCVNEMK